MENISLVWLKRDLRLNDHDALSGALKTKKKVLLLYVFEDVLINDHHYSKTQFDFIKESLRDINQTLKKHKTIVCIAKGNIIKVLESISKQFIIKCIHVTST